MDFFSAPGPFPWHEKCVKTSRFSGGLSCLGVFPFAAFGCVPAEPNDFS